MASVKERVLKLCEQKGVRIGTLEKKTGMSNGTIRKWSDNTIPGGATLLAIADHFAVSVDYLLGRTDDKTIHIIKTPSGLDGVLEVHKSGSGVLTPQEIEAIRLLLEERMKG
jgi:transcriptional regulator with XRE-family HTH domain